MATQADMTCVRPGSGVASDRKPSSSWLNLRGNALAHLSGQSKGEVSGGGRRGCSLKENVLARQKGEREGGVVGEGDEKEEEEEGKEGGEGGRRGANRAQKGAGTGGVPCMGTALSVSHALTH